jgi:exopolysaccharide biosynthesis protein
VHRFRLPVAGLRVSVVDLGYTRPLGDVLGDADLVINGGYWGWIDERRRTLIGLLVSGGKQLSPLRETLKGGVLTLHAGRASISGSHGYTLPRGADLALQCRPRLIVDRGVLPGLNATTQAARTAACVRDGGATLDMYVTDPDGQGTTLDALARWLLAEGCDHALNLDGGPSTAAAFHERGEVVRLGPGERLPYALRFRY